ncbi:F-box protein CPR1-like [Rhododendron vialii]|uniref:F-box protein CPR1-like n=1 Tax=Rhododendron vialii TaxID=182163 RepID=UPI00265EF771|nr:F-box protein CPR1-like [Rhododendron vialii]
MLSCWYNNSDLKSYCNHYANITYVVVYSMKTYAWKSIQGSHHHPLGCPSRGSGGLDGSLVIVAFNLSDEIFKEVPTLFSHSEIWYHCMAVLGGSLCVIVYPPNFCNEVWMMKEYRVRDSRTKFMINTKMVLLDWLCLLAEDKILLKIKGNVLEEVDQDKLVVYSMKKKTLRDMVVCGIPPKCPYEGTYVKSLVSLNHGGGIGRNEWETSSGSFCETQMNFCLLISCKSISMLDA